MCFWLLAGATLSSCQPNPLGESDYYSTQGAILSFSLDNPATQGTINQEKKTIKVPVAWGTDVSSLTPQIDHTGTALTPASGTSENFTNPVTYTITQKSGALRSYQASVATTGTLHRLPATIANEHGWSSIAYGNGRFVALSENGLTAASTDGVDWTNGSLAAGVGWNSVAYGNGLFVAVGGYYGLAVGSEGSSTAFSASSTDGVTWTTNPMPTASHWSAVAFGNGVFVAMTAFGDRRIAWSTNGVQWTGEAFPAGLPQSIFSITYGNGRFVAVGGNFYSATTVAAASSDGIAWTAPTLPNNAVWGSVSFGNGRFLALPYEGSGGQFSGTVTNVAATSADGLTWTARTLPSAASWSAGTYGNGIFVAFSDTSVASSPDGAAWNVSTVPEPVLNNAVDYANGRFVAFSDGFYVAHSLTSP